MNLLRLTFKFSLEDCLQKPALSLLKQSALNNDAFVLKTGHGAAFRASPQQGISIPLVLMSGIVLKFNHVSIQ